MKEFLSQKQLQHRLAYLKEVLLEKWEQQRMIQNETKQVSNKSGYCTVL